jgi:hypothetical protein
MDDWRPTAAHINALPEPVRSFIHQLETHVVDPAGDVAQLVLGKDTIRQLEAALAESEAEVTALHAERDRLKAELVMAHRFRLEDAADHCEGQILEVDRRKRAEAEAARLRAALEDCRDYLKGRAPVLEGMALLTTVNAALASSGTVPSQAERKQLAESIAARIAGSSSGTALRENIIESLLTFPAVTKTVSMLASGTVQDRLNKGQN